MRIFIVAVFILSFVRAYASDEHSAFTDQMEQDFYDAVKEQGKGHSEAEIELAVGAGLLDMNNQWQRAEKHFKRAVRLDPNLYMAWYDLGLIHIDSEEGMGYFRRAIQARPDFSASYYWIAYYYTRQGDFNKALPIWQDYLKAANLERAKGKGVDENGRMRIAEDMVRQIRSGKTKKSQNWFIF